MVIPAYAFGAIGITLNRTHSHQLDTMLEGLSILKILKDINIQKASEILGCLPRSQKWSSNLI